MSDKKPRITDEERKLFREAMKKIKSVKPEPLKRREEPTSFSDNQFYTAPAIPNTFSAEDTLHYAKPGLQDRLLQKLKRGKITPQASLDLHQHTVAMAERAVDAFIQEAIARHIRCVRIIHGKGSMTKEGRAKLKNWLNGWLRHQASVLAFHSAQPRDGGKGAVYVLLKRSTS